MNLYKNLIIFLLIISSLLDSCTGKRSQDINKIEIKPIFQADFGKNNLEQKWLLTSKKEEVLLDISKHVVDGQAVFKSPMTLKGPKFAIDRLSYYRLDFSVKTSAKTMWAMVFFDENGNQLMADIYSSFNASENLSKRIFYFQSKYDATKAQFWLQPQMESTNVGIANVKITPVKDLAVINDWADSVYAVIPSIPEIERPADRNQFIPKTMHALKTGEKLRIVMLGNSIINDTGNSAWEVLLRKAWPRANVEVITSVRGGTGCWYYQHEHRIDTFVVRYQPDLLIIGGISQRNDTAAIHNVIDQVRAKMSPEILVFTGPVGRGGDPRSNPEFTIPAKEGDYRLMLKDMAERANVGYWDMQTEWGKYIRTSGVSYDFYLRDPVHANAHGRQVLARLMLSYFADY